MARQNEPQVPILRVKKGDSLKTIYAKAQKAFSADDLQRFTETDEGIPARQLLADLEGVDRENRLKRGKKSRNGRSH